MLVYGIPFVDILEFYTWGLAAAIVFTMVYIMLQLEHIEGSQFCMAIVLATLWPLTLLACLIATIGKTIYDPRK